MRKYLLLAACLISGAVSLWGQANFAVIPVKVEGDISEDAAKIIFRKTEQILTRNSAAAAGAADVFAVNAKLTVTNKAETSGLIRNVASVSGELTLIALNKIDNAKYYSATVPLQAAVKSGGESAAIVALANSIKPTDAVFTRFVRVAREKVEEYYSDHCEEVLARAKTLALSGQVDVGMIYLTGMPPSAPCHDEALELIGMMRAKLDQDKAEAEAKEEAKEERRHQDRMAKDSGNDNDDDTPGVDSRDNDGSLGNLYVESPFWKFRVESAEYLSVSRKVKIVAYVTYVGDKSSGNCNIAFRKAIDSDGNSFDTCYVEGDTYRDFPDDVPVKLVFYIDNVKRYPGTLSFVGFSIDYKKIEIRNLPISE